MHQLGGTIIPYRMRARRSSALMRNDQITLYIASDLNEYANGTLYLDDGETFNYAKNKEYLYRLFTYEKSSDSSYHIKSKNLNPTGTFVSNVYIEKIVIRGIKYYPRNIHLYNDG